MSRHRPGWEDEVPMEDMEVGALRLLTWWKSWECPAPDLSDVLAARLPDAPHLIAIWEPLLTKAPSPPRCMPFCCYSRTVIFYHRPYIKAPPHPYHRGGHVCWSKSRRWGHKRWWMRFWARRQVAVAAIGRRR